LELGASKSVDLIGNWYFSPMYRIVTDCASFETNGSLVPGWSITWPYGIWIGTAFVMVTICGCGTGVAVAVGAGVSTGGGVAAGAISAAGVSLVGGASAGDDGAIGAGAFFAGIGGSNGMILITGWISHAVCRQGL